VAYIQVGNIGISFYHIYNNSNEIFCSLPYKCIVNSLTYSSNTSSHSPIWRGPDSLLVETTGNFSPGYGCNGVWFNRYISIVCWELWVLWSLPLMGSLGFIPELHVLPVGFAGALFLLWAHPCSTPWMASCCRASIWASRWLRKGKTRPIDSHTFVYAFSSLKCKTESAYK